jgi:hypothetical protein
MRASVLQNAQYWGQNCCFNSVWHNTNIRRLQSTNSYHQWSEAPEVMRRICQYLQKRKPWQNCLLTIIYEDFLVMCEGASLDLSWFVNSIIINSKTKIFLSNICYPNYQRTRRFWTCLSFKSGVRCCQCNVILVLLEDGECRKDIASKIVVHGSTIFFNLFFLLYLYWGTLWQKHGWCRSCVSREALCVLLEEKSTFTESCHSKHCMPPGS